MPLPISVSYTFATQTGSIPLSQIDSNFTTVVNAINGIGNGTNSLANVSITGGSAANLTTLAATTGNITTLSVTTLSIGGSQPFNGPAFFATRTSSDTIQAGAAAVLNLNVELFDTNSNYNTDNNRFTPTRAGYYLFTFTLLNDRTAVTRIQASIRKNGNASLVYYGSSVSSGEPSNASHGSVILSMNGTSDYVQMYGYCEGATMQYSNSTFTGAMIRGA